MNYFDTYCHTSVSHQSGSLVKDPYILQAYWTQIWGDDFVEKQEHHLLDIFNNNTALTGTAMQSMLTY